ncbi:hypothetical protein Franean1_1382 [Parafrankia sp. EAN1pec]|uniref:hypothetical protein n=1 Tax=Parafrankia sp. (strain EAN1pec) TaxID=298653 RepID=UPI000054306B|nr:hypothetical protein Franean1_1382 [Frankia sp. EAN1pec]
MTLPSPTAPDNTPFHSFRVAGGSVVLDLPFRPPPGWTVRAATLWPDSRSSFGWSADHWALGPGGRGFVPGLIDVGDVIQFAAESQTPQHELPANIWAPRQTPTAAQPRAIHSWFGYLHGITRTSLIVRGPYPSPEAAYYTAQRALQIDLARTETARELPHPAEPLHPAAPPAAVSLDYHGDAATVGDPYHGWITVPSRDLASALMLPRHELIHRLRGHVPHLSGREPQVTIAALAARHIPTQLPDLLNPPTPTPPPHPPGVPGPSQPTPAGPEGPAAAEPAPSTTEPTATDPPGNRHDVPVTPAAPSAQHHPDGTPGPPVKMHSDPDAATSTPPPAPSAPTADPTPTGAAAGPSPAGPAEAHGLANTGWVPPDLTLSDPGIDLL